MTDGKIRIVILSQYYPPEHGAPQNRLHDLAVRLQGAGMEISVLTAMPNYPKGEVFPEYKGRFFLREEIDGIKVLRTWIFPSRKKSTFRQLLCYFSFLISAGLFGLIKLGRTDFLICESPPLFLGLTALLLNFAKSAKLVMNISDLWPESAVQLGMIGPGMALSLLERFERCLYCRSALVLCQTKGIEEGVRRTCSSTETFLFPNGVALEQFIPRPWNPEFRGRFEIPDDAFLVGYAGNYGRSQALRQILEAAEIIKDREKVFFVFFGDGPEKEDLAKYISVKGLLNVRLCQAQPRNMMSELVSQFDVAVVPLKNIEIFKGARPSKMFELMACKVPFIFCGEGEGAEIAVKSGCARIVAPENPKELAACILELASCASELRSEMGRKGRDFVEKEFNRKNLAERLIEKLRALK